MFQVHALSKLCHLWNVLYFVSWHLTAHSSPVLIEAITQQSLHIFLYLTR